MSKPTRKAQPTSFASMLEQTSYFVHACEVPNCDNTIPVGQHFCDSHRCDWYNEDGLRCEELAVNGRRCPSHALVIVEQPEDDVSPTLPQPTEDVIPEASGVTQSITSDDIPTQTIQKKEPKQLKGRRVRKTWELPSTGLDTLADFGKEIQDNIGVKISEAQHVSIAIQVYSDIINASPTLLATIDQAITGTETFVQAQDVVTRIIREHVANLVSKQ